MTLLSSAYFEREALASESSLSESVYSYLPDNLHSLKSDDDLKNRSSLAYNLGYGVLQQSYVLSDSQSEQSPEDEQPNEQFSSEYMTAEAFPFEKFSVLRCFQKDRRVYYKNLYAISLVFLFLTVAHEGLVGIEATINSDKGRATLAVENALLVCSVVIAPAVIWLLGIRNAILLACVLQICYVVSNYLRRYYTLIPGAIIGGFSLGIVSVAANLYKSIMATNLATVAGIQPTIVIGKFGGVFYAFVSISLVFGNLISSVVFIVKEEVNCDHRGFTMTTNRTGISFDNISNDSGGAFPVCSCDTVSGIVDNTRYILVSIYVLANIIAIVLLLLTVGNVTRVATDSGKLRARFVLYFRHSIISIFRAHFNTRVSLFIPVFMLEGLQTSYYLGSFTTDFIAQCIGVRYVGFGVAVWAFGIGVGSFVSGRTVKYVKRFTLFFISTGLSLFLCLFLIFFERVESFPLIFLVSFGFGLSDGVLKTGISCLVSGRFYKLKTTVYSILRMWIGVGLMIHFALSIVLPHDVLLWIIVATAGVGIPLYGLVDWQWKFSPC